MTIFKEFLKWKSQSIWFMTSFVNITERLYKTTPDEALSVRVGPSAAQSRAECVWGVVEVEWRTRTDPSAFLPPLWAALPPAALPSCSSPDALRCETWGLVYQLLYEFMMLQNACHLWKLILHGTQSICWPYNNQSFYISIKDLLNFVYNLLICLNIHLNLELFFFFHR